jgi:hypothetical protein
MKLQLIGPMQGQVDFNHPAFRDAAKLLREQGHEVFSPAEIDGGDTSRPTAYYMRGCIGALLRADGVVLLPGWQGSANCKTELRIALALGLAVLSMENNIPAWALGREEPDD